MNDFCLVVIELYHIQFSHRKTPLAGPIKELKLNFNVVKPQQELIINLKRYGGNMVFPFGCDLLLFCLL